MGQEELDDFDEEIALDQVREKERLQRERETERERREAEKINENDNDGCDFELPDLDLDETNVPEIRKVINGKISRHSNFYSWH